MKKENYNNIIKEFKQINALVIGDIILDEYFLSNENGTSPEANVKKYKVENHFYKIGGAGNVAVNLKSLNINNMILVTRSRKKVVGLNGYGIKIIKQEIIKWV